MKLMKLISFISINALFVLSGCKKPDTSQNDGVIELTVNGQEQASAEEPAQTAETGEWEELAQAIKTAAWGEKVTPPAYLSGIKTDEATKLFGEFFSRFHSIEKNIKQLSGAAPLYGESEEITAFEVQKGTVSAINIIYLGSREGTAAIYLKNSAGDIVWESEELDESQEYFLLLNDEEGGSYTVCWNSDIVFQTLEDIPKMPCAMVNVLAVPLEYQQLFEGGINIP